MVLLFRFLPGTTSMPQIKLADEFSVRIEVVAHETNRVTNIRMFYSLSRNQIRLSILDSGLKSDMYFYFDDNEILTFDYSVGRGNCTVNPDLANAADTFIVGGTKDKRVRDALGVLHFTGASGFGDQIQTAYLGVRSIRDMDVDAFTSCQKWSMPGGSAVVNVTHYFSNKTWSRPDPQNVPVAIELHGSAVIHNQISQIDHMYNYFDFQTSIDATIFETPPGIICIGRNMDAAFPNLPTYIKFSGEIINGVENDVSRDHLLGMLLLQEIYDSDDDFVIIRTQSELAYGTQGGMNEFTYIRDYVSGLPFHLLIIQNKNVEQWCAIQNITAADPLPVDYINPQGKVTDVTPQQLFFADSTEYEYLGERNIRGILADTWVTRTTIPAFPNQVSTVEWYFAKTDVTSWNDGSQEYKTGQFRMPVLLRVWRDDTTLTSIDTNIYHVDFTRIMYGVLDIRSCYPDRPSNHFQIILQEFELLDAPPYASDISGPIFQSISLQQAAQKLNASVTSGNLSIYVWNPATQKIDKVSPTSTIVFTQYLNIQSDCCWYCRNLNSALAAEDKNEALMGVS
ncbi:unnamed protein product [Candidula unifasciata]|uniref:LolA-like domain-containing protein n=1 Tax=Candidula unifasciata TaxID=100452 RepID=A0A8S3YQ62_9EUPU|nr:unnamed protein product [Candidula unifasciata]